MTWLQIAVAVLALWRASAMLAYERGPRDVLLHLRERLGVIDHDEDGKPATWDESRWTAGVVTCVWCLSVNLAVPYALAWFVAPTVTFWLSLPLALSAGAIIVEAIAHGKS